MDIRQITIIGTGLIGGSFGLAVRARGFRGRIVGCDRDEVLAEAQAMDAIDAGCSDPIHAARGSDVVLLATPVGGIIELLEMGQVFPEHALITDVGSTKQEIIARARSVFAEQTAARFLPGHPMAGKEHGGIQYASADLFEGAVWLVTPLPQQDIWTGRSGAFLQLVQTIGARVVSMDPERHDRLCAWVSHLPQMISTALAASLEDEFGNDPELQAIGGRALREMTRIASSPYSMWGDIAKTNTANIQEAILRLEQRLAHLRENLRTPELQVEFQRAHQFKNK